MKLVKTLPTILLLVLSSTSFSLTYKEIKDAYQKSYLYEKVGDYKDAIRALMSIYEAYPNGYTVNLRLGWLYYLWGKYENSIYHYKKAVKAIPTSVEAKLGLSLPLMAQQKWNEAENILYQVLKIDYYNYYGNLRLCLVLEGEKKYPLVESIALKMLAIYPTSVPFLVYLAKSYYHLGKLKEAKKIFKDILILDPENVIAKSYLKKLENKKKPKKEGKKSTQP